MLYMQCTFGLSPFNLPANHFTYGQPDSQAIIPSDKCQIDLNFRLDRSSPFSFQQSSEVLRRFTSSLCSTGTHDVPEILVPTSPTSAAAVHEAYDHSVTHYDLDHQTPAQIHEITLQSLPQITTYRGAVPDPTPTAQGPQHSTTFSGAVPVYNTRSGYEFKGNDGGKSTGGDQPISTYGDQILVNFDHDISTN